LLTQANNRNLWFILSSPSQQLCFQVVTMKSVSVQP
jgi:hypothetical protein